MKKFRFSLQKILEIKEQILDNFKIELSSLNADLISIELAIKSLYLQYTNSNKEFLEKSSAGISVGEMTYYKILMNGILKQVDKKESEKLIVNKKIELKRQEIVNMNMEISSIEKLKEKELERYNHAVTRNEEIFIEEFVSNKSLVNNYAI